MFFLAIAAAIAVGLAVRKRVEIVDGIKKFGKGGEKKKPPRGSSSGDSGAADVAVSSGVMAPKKAPGVSLSMPSIKRKKKDPVDGADVSSNLFEVLFLAE